MKKFLFILIFCINLFGEERIVTLSPSINEIVFALEKGENIVANTMFCDYPIESKSIPKIGGYSSISLEKLLEAKPTIVIGQDYDEKLIENIKALNIKVLSYKTNTIENITNTITITSPAAYRYYALKLASNYGDGSFLGIRRLKFYEASY